MIINQNTSSKVPIENDENIIAKDNSQQKHDYFNIADLVFLFAAFFFSFMFNGYVLFKFILWFGSWISKFFVLSVVEIGFIALLMSFINYYEFFKSGFRKNGKWKFKILYNSSLIAKRFLNSSVDTAFVFFLGYLLSLLIQF